VLAHMPPHPNVVQYYGCWSEPAGDGEHLYLQLEKCDVNLAIHSTLGEQLREGDLLEVLRQVRSACRTNVNVLGSSSMGVDVWQHSGCVAAVRNALDLDDCRGTLWAVRNSLGLYKCAAFAFMPMLRPAWLACWRKGDECRDLPITVEHHLQQGAPYRAALSCSGQMHSSICNACRWHRRWRTCTGMVWHTST